MEVEIPNPPAPNRHPHPQKIKKGKKKEKKEEVFPLTSSGVLDTHFRGRVFASPASTRASLGLYSRRMPSIAWVRAGRTTMFWGEGVLVVSGERGVWLLATPRGGLYFIRGVFYGVGMGRGWSGRSLQKSNEKQRKGGLQGVCTESKTQKKVRC